MPRKKTKSLQREPNPDRLYSSVLVQRLIHKSMKDGKKSVARKVFADTMNEIKAAGHMNPNGVLFTAIENAAPSIMVKSKRV